MSLEVERHESDSERVIGRERVREFKRMTNIARGGRKRERFVRGLYEGL